MSGNVAAFRLVQHFYTLCLSRLIMGLFCPLDIVFRWLALDDCAFNHRSFLLTNLALVIGSVLGSFSNIYGLQATLPSIILSGPSIATLLAATAMILTCT